MKIKESDKNRILKRLLDYQTSSANPYLELSSKYKGVTISLYKSGKIVFQGGAAKEVAHHFGFQTESDDSKNQSDNSYKEDLPLIGSDEVGNGSYFGGIAVVASFVSPSDHPFLKSLGVDDSKNLNDQKIRQIAPLLEEKIQHKALLLSPQKYNQLVGKGKAYNAVSVKVALHNQAIYLLLEKGLKPQKIVIDAFTSQANYEKYLLQEKNHFKNVITFQEKAESKYLAVAVSSIIARNLFLENLDQLSQELAYKLPSGAGKASDQVACQLLETYGLEALNHSAKLHFVNTLKAQELLKNRK